MYSMHNEGKFVIAEILIRTLENEIYKYITSISKNVYIDKLDDIVNKYNNTYHSAIKMKPVDVKLNTYINSSKEINHKNPKFEIGDIIKISKYKNIFAKSYVQNWSDEVFLIKKVKTTVLWNTNVISDLNGEKIVGMLYRKNRKKEIKKSSKLKK